MIMDRYFEAMHYAKEQPNLTQTTNTYIYDHDVALTNKQIFLADLSICQELTLDEWQRRPRWQRPLERLFRRFAHLL